MVIKIFCLDVEGEGEKEGDQNEEGREKLLWKRMGLDVLHGEGKRNAS